MAVSSTERSRLHRARRKAEFEALRAEVERLAKAPAAHDSASRGKATRLPNGWEPDEPDVAFAVQWLGGKWRGELERFRDYWTAQVGHRAVKASWPATWRNWVRRSVEDAGVRATAVKGRVANDKREERRAELDDVRARLRAFSRGED